MKKIVMLLMAVAIMCFGLQVTAYADRYNPYDDLYKVVARSERSPGQAQLVYVVIDKNRTPIAGATINYSNYQGATNAIVTNAQGKARMVFTGRDYVRIESVVVNGVVLRAIGEDLSDSIDAEDIQKGDVEYYMLVVDQSAGIVQAYDAS